jgi:hypothetical protein
MKTWTGLEPEAHFGAGVGGTVGLAGAGAGGPGGPGGGGAGGPGGGPGLTLFGTHESLARALVLQPPLTSATVLNQQLFPSQTPAAQPGRFVHSVQHTSLLAAGLLSREPLA